MEQTIGAPKTETEGIDARRLFDAARSGIAALWQALQSVYWRLERLAASGLIRTPDADRTARELGVVKRAELDASRDLPPADESAPAGMQREIINHFSNLRQSARKQIVSDSEKLRARLERLDNQEVLSKLRDLPAACEHNAARIGADYSSELQKALEKESHQKKYYETFRRTHELDRVATYPEASSLNFLGMLLLYLAVAIALTHMAGVQLFQSPLWAAGVAAFAIVVPYVLGGPLLRSLNHVSELRNFVGAVGTVLLLGMIAATAFYADFHIAALGADPGQTYPSVTAAILASPAGIFEAVADWKVFGLIGLSGLFAISLAFRADDPYPGYGAAQKAYFGARSAREDVTAELRRRINSTVDSHEKQLMAVVRDFKKKVRACVDRAERLHKNVATLRNYDAELEDACNLVLDRYRAANRAARSSEAPISFAEQICFPPDSDFDPARYTDGLPEEAEFRSAVADVEKEGDYARDKLRALNLNLIETIR